MTYSALTIAGYVVNRSNDIGYAISNLKLQKLLYFIQAEFLMRTGHVCFNDEIQAWDFGPVVPGVYEAYRIYGGANIPKGSSFAADEKILPEDRKIIDTVVKDFAPYSAATLVEITHQQDPWRDAYSRDNHNLITTQAISNYYNSICWMNGSGIKEA